MRDTVAELAERAQVISQEAGTKVAAAMKDVISAAAGVGGFAIESARDLVQYMVRRGQMTQEEADKLLREAEEGHARRSPSERSRPTVTKVAADRAAHAKALAASAAAAAVSSGRAGSAGVAPVRVPSKGEEQPAKTAPQAAPARAQSAKPKAVAKGPRGSGGKKKH